MSSSIHIYNAREHNLRGFDLEIPRDAMTVVTGVSGSGKSSLAFDTLYQEGQRRFLESLSPYARQFLGQMERPKVDRVDGLSPTLCIDQKTVNRNPRSTVGTITEIYDHFRLLFARLGTPRCPVCLRAIARQSPGELADRLLRAHEGQRLVLLAPVVRDRKGEYRKELEGWHRDGWLRARINGTLVDLETPPELGRYDKHTIEIVLDRLTIQASDRGRLVEGIERSLRMAKGVVATLVGESHAVHAIDRSCPDHEISIPEMEPRLFSFNAPQGACPTCVGLGGVILGPRGTLLPAPAEADASLRRACPTCAGRRLNPIALAVAFRDHSIDQMTHLTVTDTVAFFATLKLDETERLLGEGLVREVLDRSRFLEAVGLGYLSLDRAANTLSGGEAQRIRLAACVGSGLVGVTYILDEPSIGLHPRDNRRLIGALHALRDAGNTVVVVEHDRETMEQSDHLVDIGPGAGRLGGELVGAAPPAEFRELPTPTARYLRGELVIPLPVARRPSGGAALRVRGAKVHNLQNVSVDLPLGRLVVLTGVSGSGKSTLLFDVVEEGVTTALAEGTASVQAGGYRIDGIDAIDKLIEISQSPIGRTPRSNPATYVGAFDLIRDLYAATPEAKARGYSKGRFSFNVAGGRCESCEGAGVRTIEMQFLANVEIPCETCLGKRFTPETLDIVWKGRSIGAVLEMTIAEAAEFFASHKRLFRILSTMERVGLGYVHLGQPATTLSGGEAQRLKLATELHRVATGRTLYLLDEPTTGLHFQDVAILIDALQALVDAGNSVVVIEHHTDLIKVADHVIELGPEGGAGGGQLLADGTPEALARLDTPTGRVLAELPELGGTRVAEPLPRVRRAAHLTADLEIRGARCHNLKGVDLTVPRGKMTVITGPSGSGKTSLAFDTVFAEGQRRYVECLSTYARRFLGRLERAPIDHVSGLGPAIAIDQRNSGHNPRSTVATVTELHDHFRLLFANLGVPHCPQCDREVRALPPAIAAGHLIAQAPGPGHLVSRLREPQSAVGLRAQGYARAWVDGPVDLDTVETVNDLVIDRLDPARADRPRIVEAIETAYRLGGNQARFIPRSGSAIPLSVSASCPEHGLIHPGPLTPRHFSFNHWLGACAACDGLGRQWVGASTVVCPGCRGQRLKAEYLAVSFAGLRPAEIAAMTVERARDWFRTLALNATEAHIAAQPTREIRGRLGFLADVGLGYLTLDRTADTLSGGEAQRIRLASQLGGGLCGVIYVLDEPTIGLHPRDTARLLGTLQGLRDLDNTLIVVEHDMQTIRAADHIVDMGPGAGEEGGNVVASGPPATLSGGATGPWLTGVRRFPVRASRRPPGPPFRLQAGTLNNLRDVHVDFPTGQLIAVTGVSGSGKSTLVMDLLVGALNGESVPARLTRPPGEWTHAVVDQAPIGRSPRSTPATYAGVMDPMRALFATTTTAKENGWGVSRFSYNSGAGACTVCGGYGHTLVEMHFLSNVWVRCGACGGRRYAPRTLEARWKGLSIADVLDLRVDHAVEVFAARRNILRPLQALASVGLGYLRLGQPATELSGGEAQRVKLACGLAVRSGHCFYILDEPTTGLHLEDIARLVEVFDHLVDAGHTVLVVEHHLDVIRHADHVIDLGPEAGDGGGNIVAQGTPDEVARVSESHTGAALRAG